MLFRPSYCADCGEKIEREDWHLWTSRRFCEICETEFKGQDLLPRVITALGVLALLVGVGGYLKSGPSTVDLATARKLKSNVEKPTVPVTANPVTIAPSQANNDTAASHTANIANAPQQAPRSMTALQPPKLTAGEKNRGERVMYYCGAPTRKGTPCTRRVKGNTRCYQHLGMPAMLPPEKLRAG